MKKIVVTLLVGAFAVSLFLGSVQARPAYPALAKEHYKDSEVIVAKTTAADKCNFCHDPNSKSKKDHNEYGKAFKKHMPTEEFMKLKGPDDKEKLAKKVGEALKAAEAEKNADGKTFGEVIKSGKLPGG